MNATVRLFDIGEIGEPKPLDAVLLVYFENTTKIGEALGSKYSIYTEASGQQKRITAKALHEAYQTSDIYLVTEDRIMVTRSREEEGGKQHQQVNTFPVRECFENG